MNANTLTIGASTIRALDGIFSLNDLHRASGGEARHKPSEWLRLQQVQELIAEMGKAGIPALVKKHGGKNGSQTYAPREAVIAYAAWISPAFHLKVIRVFLDAVAPVQQSLPYSIATGQTLSQEQADMLRNTLTAHAEQLPPNERGAFLTKGWSKLKAHFKTDYRHIPAHQFTEAMSIVARHIEGNPAVPKDAAALNDMAEHFIQAALHIKAAANRIAAANGGVGSALWVNPPMQYLR